MIKPYIYSQMKLPPVAWDDKSAHLQRRDADRSPFLRIWERAGCERMFKCGVKEELDANVYPATSSNYNRKPCLIWCGGGGETRTRVCERSPSSRLKLEEPLKTQFRNCTKPSQLVKLGSNHLNGSVHLPGAELWVPSLAGKILWCVSSDCKHIVHPNQPAHFSTSLMIFQRGCWLKVSGNKCALHDYEL